MRWVGRPSSSVGQTEACRLSRFATEAIIGSKRFRGVRLHLLGDIWAQPSHLNAERAETHYREALNLAETRGMRPLVAHCHLGLGTLYRRTGDRAKANEHLTTAATMYREMDMRFWLEKAEGALKEAGQ